MADYEITSAAVRDRINQLLNEKGLSQNSVASGDTAAQKRLNNQLSHGGNITLDTVLRVLNACPDISADWLLCGMGDKYKGQTITGAGSVKSRNATVIGQQNTTLPESLVRDLLSEKDRQIQALLDIVRK